MALRVVVWNCAQALDRKTEQLISLKPDIAIIPECAEPDILRRKAPDFMFTDCEWTGEQRNKGLGVFSFDGHTLRRHQSWDRQYHIFLPLEVRGTHSVNLLAVWAFNHRAPATVSPSPKTTREAIGYYSDFLKAQPSVVAGDFNNNVIWDKPGHEAGFASVNSALDDVGLGSGYHGATIEEFGREKQPTLWWQRRAAQCYHVDYIYAPKEWQPACRMTVGDSETWLKHSDHAPLLAEWDETPLRMSTDSTER